MHILTQVLAVAAGGALGSTLRYLTSLGTTRLVGTAFPLGTLTVNVVGSLLAGFIFILFEELASFSPLIRLLVMVGFLGGFTTFSAFSLDIITMLQDGRWGVASLNLGANLVLGFGAVVGGIYLGKVIV